MTTGGGGMILTDDKALATRAKHLTTTARVAGSRRYWHDAVGYNYRMPNLNAALGCAQLEALPDILRKKKTQAEKLREYLNGIVGVAAVDVSSGEGNHWFNLVDVESLNANEVLEHLNEKGILAREAWIPLHRMKPYMKFESFGVECADELSNSLICLPNGILRSSPDAHS
jgi:perosamine synthetase